MTQTLYDTYASLLAISSNLVKALERADWYDRLLILAALVLFLAVVGWVLKRRVWNKVFGGLGWWVVASWHLVRKGLGGGGGTDVGKYMGDPGKGVTGLAAGASAVLSGAGAVRNSHAGETALPAGPPSLTGEECQPSVLESVVRPAAGSSAISVGSVPATDEGSRQRDEL